jgi:putative ubiquitin-RnfH superfamily antitoxin RatB of RatAB toxin-antitoxin module
MWIEIAYAKPSEQVILELDVPEGTTVEAAIGESAILQRFPEIDLTQNKVGIFSKPCNLDHPLRAGDRVEIYRPLLADPKQARRNRAAKH